MDINDMSRMFLFIYTFFSMSKGFLRPKNCGPNWHQF